MVDPCKKKKRTLKGRSVKQGTPEEEVVCDVSELKKELKGVAEKTEKKVPDELREPEEEFRTERVFLLPEPLVIESLPVEVACEDPTSEGDPVSLPMGFKTQKLYFSVVLSLSEEVLDFIARRRLERLISLLLNSGNDVREEISKLTGMKLKQADELIAAARQVQDNLTSAVEAYARSLLVCCWWNTPQEAQCEDEAMAHDGDHPDAVFWAYVPAHTFKSCYSLEAANNQALLAAQSMLNCFYLSDPFLALCEERPTRPYPDMEPVPNDEVEIYPGRGLRVGTYYVPAAQFTSIVSKEDANRRAQDFGYSQLVCWYPNDPVHAECSDPNARDMGMDPSKVEAHAADVEHGIAGQWVDVPMGYFTSDFSREFATQQAYELADSLLACCYINRPYRIACTAQDVVLSTGVHVWVQPQPYPTSPRPEVVVEAGKFTSCNSQEEADEFARQSIEGMLDCRYCNEPVLPTCVPDWVLIDVQLPEDHPDHIDLPLKDGEIKDTTHDNLSISSLPLNATMGAAACTVISPDAQEAQFLADMLGMTPATSGEQGGAQCTYFNDKVIAGCAVINPYSEDGSPAGVDPDGNPYIFYSRYPDGTCLYDEMSTPAPGHYITIDAGMFMGKGEWIKPYLNQRAIDYATSMLFCPMTNPKTEVTCFFKGSATAHLDICDSSWRFFRNQVDPDLPPPEFWRPNDENKDEYYVPADLSDTPEMLMEWSNTDEKPIHVARGMVFAIGYEKEEANTIIFNAISNFVTGMIRCDFGNYAVNGGKCTNDCRFRYDQVGMPPIPNTCGTDDLSAKMQPTDDPCYLTPWDLIYIPEKVFIADTAREATQIALRLTDTSLFCSLDHWIKYSLENIPDFHIEEWQAWWTAQLYPSPTSHHKQPGPGPGPGGGDYSSPNQAGKFSEPDLLKGCPAPCGLEGWAGCVACDYCACPAYENTYNLYAGTNSTFGLGLPIISVEEAKRREEAEVEELDEETTQEYERLKQELEGLEKELETLLNA